MPDTQVFLDEVKSGITSLLREFATNQALDVTSVSQNFVDRSSDDLKRWTTLLAQGDLNETDFRSLVKGIAGLAAITALKQLGLAQARVDELKGKIVDTIVGSALKLIP